MEAQIQQKTPSDFLKSVIGRPVIVKLSNGSDFRGVLACLDGLLNDWLETLHLYMIGYMNIAMEQTEEYKDNLLKSNYGDTFIRGNNVLYISTQKRKK